MEHRLGDLMLAHHHDIGAVPLEVIDLFFEMRPGDDGKRGIDGAGLLHRLPALERIGDGDEQAARGT
jgi:hypothetical protein